MKLLRIEQIKKHTYISKARKIAYYNSLRTSIKEFAYYNSFKQVSKSKILKSRNKNKKNQDHNVVCLG